LTLILCTSELKLEEYEENYDKLNYVEKKIHGFFDFFAKYTPLSI